MGARVHPSCPRHAAAPDPGGRGGGGGRGRGVTGGVTADTPPRAGTVPPSTRLGVCSPRGCAWCMSYRCAPPHHAAGACVPRLAATGQRSQGRSQRRSQAQPPRQGRSQILAQGRLRRGGLCSWIAAGGWGCRLGCQPPPRGVRWCGARWRRAWRSVGAGPRGGCVAPPATPHRVRAGAGGLQCAGRSWVAVRPQSDCHAARQAPATSCG